MGCFPVHREGARQTSTKRKSVSFLGWTFRLIFPSSSKFSSTSGSSESSEDVAVAPKLQDLRVFTLAELKAATKNFSLSEKVGEGGFGNVYKGVVKDKGEKIEIAVKKLNIKGQQGHKEWLSEITYLRMVDHPNLVKLHGYCVEDDERGPQCLLVYEFMPNKSLDEHIFNHGQVLPWEKRLQVALGTAKGLAYLHEQVKPHIIYRDLKAGNILLDNDFNPKLSDFGLARDGPGLGHTHVTTAVVGTAGYAAPDYVQTGHLTSKSDVWSFGMVLLELLTGRRALDMNRPRSERSLADWVKPYANDNKKFRKVIDPRIKTQVPVDQAKRVMALAQKCIAKIPKSRPRMSEVAKQLRSIIEPEVVPVGDGGTVTVSMSSITDISATGSDLTTFYESQDMSSGLTNSDKRTSSSDGFSQDIFAAGNTSLKEHGEGTDIQTPEDHPEDRKTSFEATELLNDGSVLQVEQREEEASDFKSPDGSEPAAERTDLEKDDLEKEHTVVDTCQESGRNDIHELQVQVEVEDKYKSVGTLDEHREGEVQGLEDEHHAQVEADVCESESKLAGDRDALETEPQDVTPAETDQREQQEHIATATEVTVRCSDRDDLGVNEATASSQEETNAGEAETGPQAEKAEETGTSLVAVERTDGGEVHRDRTGE